MLIFFLQK